MRMTSTCGMIARLSRKNRSLAAGNVSGSPPETITSRISGWSRTYSIIRSSSRLTASHPPRTMVARFRVQMRQAAHRHVLVFFEGVFQLVAERVLGFERTGHRLEPNGVVRVVTVD